MPIQQNRFANEILKNMSTPPRAIQTNGNRTNMVKINWILYMGYTM